MRDFCFIKKSDGLKAMLKTDIVDDLTQIFTIMYLEGVEGTYFEKIIPFQAGTVLTVSDMNAWFELNKADIDGFVYGGEQIGFMGKKTFNLNITPKVVGANQCSIILTASDGGEVSSQYQDVVKVQNGIVKTLKMVDNWAYAITSEESVITGDNPAIGVINSDKSIDLTFNISR